MCVILACPASEQSIAVIRFCNAEENLLKNVYDLKVVQEITYSVQILEDCH